MDVKRYECQCYEGGMGMAPDGAYVTFADYDRLRKLYEAAWEECETAGVVIENAPRGCLSVLHAACDKHDKAVAAHDTLRKEAGL